MPSMPAFATAFVSETISTRMMKLKRAMCAGGVLAMALLFGAGSASAQIAPIAFPYTVTTVVGTGVTGTASACTYAGPATSLVLGNDVRGMSIDPLGNLVFTDSASSCTRRYNPTTGTVTQVLGGGAATTAGTACPAGGGTATDAVGDGCLISAASAKPRGMALDSVGNVYLADYGNKLVRVACFAQLAPWCTAGQVGRMVLLGGGGASIVNGAIATSSLLNQPRGVSVDAYGNVFIADTADNIFRVIYGGGANSAANPVFGMIQANPTYASTAPTQGFIYPLAGNQTGATGAVCGGATDTSGNNCPYYTTTSGSGPAGTAVDSAGNIYLADTGNKTIRMIYMGATGATNAASKFIAAETGTAISGTFPVQYNIYRVAGTFTGTGTVSSSNTPTLATTDAYGGPQKINFDPNGNLYVADSKGGSFIDFNTGYSRLIFGSGTNVAAGAACVAPSGQTVSGQTAINAVSDGCRGTEAAINLGGNGVGIAADANGNVYMSDSGDFRIRLISSQVTPPTALNASTLNHVEIHVASGDTAGTPVLQGGSTEFALGSGSCVNYTSTDGSQDCIYPVTFTAKGAGRQTVPFLFSSTNGSVNLGLSGTGTGDEIATDVATPATAALGSGLAPRTVTVDSGGNVYTVDTTTGQNKLLKIAAGGGSSVTVGTFTSSTNPQSVAVDAAGNVYTANTTVATVTKIPTTGAGTYGSAVNLSLPGITSPQAVAVDAAGNILVEDSVTGNVTKFPVNATFAPNAVIASGFSTDAVTMTIDPSGNLYIADSTAKTVTKVSGTATTTLSGVTAIAAVGVAVDAAGDVYLQDAVTNSVIEVPVSGSNVTVLTGLTTPNGVAVDSNGQVYVSDLAGTSITQVKRSAVSFDFGTNTALAFNGTITNVGNVAVTGSARTDTADFTYVAGATAGCAFASNQLVSQAVGNACSLVGSFAPQAGTGVVSDVLTYLPTPTVGNITLTGTKTGAAVTTTTTIGGQTPASPVYASSGTEVTFTVTVAASSGTASGSVAVTVDSLAPVNYTLNGSGVATVPLSGLGSGNHTISAIYATQNGFTGSSTSSATNFSIAQATTTVTWTPGATSQQVSAAVGNTVLNASAGSTPGYYMYTATPQPSGTAIVIHAASYLPIGTYTLGVTFQPTDTVNFSGSTASGGTYTVTQATTTAAIGGTQFLVAADGTGNFPNVQNAINAMPSTGGNIYIKPGTYNGFVTVAYPNVSLRGLGGNASAVILTNYAGAFSQPAITNTQTNGNNNTQGDEGSATLVVAKTTAPNGSQPTPNNFYAGNLTLVNTWDTDNTILDTIKYTGGSTCTTGNTPQTHQALFNAGNLCYSQALAIWITADQAVLDNVYTSSLQDTIYNGSQGCGGTCVAARQYWWRGKVTGNVDFIFGDSASVFDHTTIYTAWHGSTAGGTETIEAQNKKFQTGSASDYLSGDIMNSDVFTSQSSGMTGLYYGRPYGQYSTYIMLNSSVDQVVPAGWGLLGFTAGYLDTSTYAEYNSQLVADPATGSPDSNGVIYLGTGGTSSIAGPRETTSLNPGTILANNNPKTSMSAAQATYYYPTAFLGTTVPTNASYVTATPATYINTFTATWDPAKALGLQMNAFVGTTLSMTANAGSYVTVLMRPQTPGGGILPTGTWTLNDNGSQVATGTLDAAGQATFSSKTLAPGVHQFQWIYGGDSNFAGSSTSGANALNVTIATGQAATTTSLLVQANNASVIYGTTVNVTATVAATNGQGAGGATGNVTLNVDGTAFQTQALVAGAYTFAVTGLGAGTHTYSASYAGDTNNAASSSTTNPTSVVTKASLTVTATNASRLYGAANPTFGITVTGLQNSDTVGTAFTGSASLTTTAVRTSAAGTYTITAAAGTLALTGSAANNYNSPAFANGTLTVTGGSAQTITFAKLPNFTHTVTVQLTARSSSGLAVTYSVISGPATVSGKALTITGAGAVTVQAAQGGNGNYAAATSVQRTFTAQ